MPCTKAYQKRHAKARQRRRRTAAERLQRDHAQAQRAIEALEQALHDLGLPDKNSLKNNLNSLSGCCVLSVL